MFDTYDLKDYSLTLKRIRKSCGYTQSDVRKLVGIHEDGLRKIENGSVIPKYETLQLLSKAYKVDLLELLAHMKSDQSLMAYIQKVNEMITSNDIEKFASVSKEIHVFLEKNKRVFQLFNSDEPLKLKLYLEAIGEYFESHHESYVNAEILLIEALTLSIEETFTIENLPDYPLNYFDISLLLLLGVIKRELSDTESSTLILNTCLERLDIFNIKTVTNDRMKLKLMYNLAYNNHTDDNYESVIEITSKAIEFATTNHILYSLPQLFYRKGIAEYQLGIDCYMDSLNKAITLLEVYGMEELKQKFIQTTLNLYGIEIG
ncbi:helix-turn-helix domain-containing protein [Isachenkonia alkalipeptolytica]|uniref:Helix-turn-helix transcriptional regulator n=1 Tax=Isachenkonia alkalipeptolytica TaxID=2565777 RepID=A0AA43XHN9_9CLOT|nr:helix-turn-helix transcriptional regulator [Isachenkonia alkalipeptolytica]NBG87068.1 helix-turn-helix transcriptional regulator [Isachenkonia alkalipeptolytica]